MLAGLQACAIVWAVAGKGSRLLEVPCFQAMGRHDRFCSGMRSPHLPPLNPPASALRWL